MVCTSSFSLVASAFGNGITFVTFGAFRTSVSVSGITVFGLELCGVVFVFAELDVLAGGFETLPEVLAGCLATSFFGTGAVVVFFIGGGGVVFFTGGGVAAMPGSTLFSLDFSFSTRNGSL